MIVELVRQGALVPVIAMGPAGIAEMGLQGPALDAFASLASPCARP